MNDLDTEHKLMFIKGVFAHELMHQLDSDFNALSKERNRLPEFEQDIFATIANVMEDPAIEYWASSYFGGHLLRALKYSIMYLYAKAVPLQESTTAFEQFLNAYIQYGDGGLLAGKFTFPEAKEYFIKALPLFDKAIEEPDGTKRIGYAKQVLTMTRPLWIEDVKNAEKFAEMMKKIEEMMKRFGKTTTGEGGKPCGSSDKEKPEGESSKEKRRSAIRKAMSCSGEETNACSSASENDESESDRSTGASRDGNPDGTSKDGKGARDENKESGTDKSEGKADGGSEGIDESEYTVTNEDIKKIKSEISTLKNTEDEGKNIKKEAESILDYSSEVNKNYNKVSCKNIVTKGDFSPLESEYQSILTPMLPGINGLYSQLKRLFVNDREEKGTSLADLLSQRMKTFG